MQTYWQPRIGLTYTVDPDTVIRASAGRYAQEPQNYEIQYNSEEENLAEQLLGFLPFGFTTPFHNAQAQFSDNYDVSYEHRFKGTDTVDEVNALLSLRHPAARREHLYPDAARVARPQRRNRGKLRRRVASN